MQRWRVVLTAVLGLSWLSQAYGKPVTGIKAAVGDIPGWKDAISAMLREISEETKVSITVEVVPFKRAVAMLIDHRVDIAAPHLRPEGVPLRSLPVDFSEATFSSVDFVLYSRKGESHVNPDAIRALTKDTLRIGSGPSALTFLPFPYQTFFNVAGGLNGLVDHHIDGFIWAKDVMDPILKEKRLEGKIRRALFKRYENHFLLPKGTGGGDVDRLLSRGVTALKAKKRLSEIFKPVESPFVTWDAPAAK